MNVYKKVTQEVEVLDDVICDICEQSCKVRGTGEVEKGTFIANWGYGTELDGQIWNLDLCVDCCWRLNAWVENLGGKIRKTG